MKNIKSFCLICYFILFTIGCTTFNISATDNNVLVDARDGLTFESIIKKTKESVVLLSTNPNTDPSIAPNQNAMCSGIIIDDIGRVLTNFHCVYKQDYIKLFYHDQSDWQTYDVNVIGIDPLADLALLEVIGKETPKSFLKFAKDADKIKDGTEVFAMGHPMGMVWTITKGIISSTERFARHPYIKAIQTDAAINQGNSGGPLLNMRGEVVGINSLLVSKAGQNAGVGIAIRGDVVKKSYESMLETGKVDRPAIGVMIRDLSMVLDRKKLLTEFPKQDSKNIPNTFGLIITDDKEIPKGLKAFDTIIGINNVMVNSGLQFSDELGKYKINDVITLTIIRKQKFLKVHVPLKIFPVPVDKLYGKR